MNKKIKIKGSDSSIITIEGTLFSGFCDATGNELYEGDYVTRTVKYSHSGEIVTLIYQIQQQQSGLWLLVDQSKSKMIDYLHVYANCVNKINK